MAVRKRCVRCRKPVRDDGTCQNEACVMFVPEHVETEQEPPVEQESAK